VTLSPPQPLPPPHDVAWSVPREQRPGEDLLVPVSITDGVVLVVWSLLGQVLVVSVMLVGLSLAGVDPTDLGGPSLGAVTVLTQSLVLAGAFAWLAGRGRWSWRLFGSRRGGLGHVLLGLSGGVLAFMVSAVVILTGNTLVGPLDRPGQTLLEPEMLAGPTLVLTFVIASVLAPLLEEVTYRGVLFQVLGRRIGWRGGVVVSSLVFAVIHLEVVLPLRVEALVFGTALFAVGCTFAVLFHRTRSLVTAIVAHATFNGVQLALAWQQLEMLGFAGAAVGS